MYDYDKLLKRHRKRMLIDEEALAKADHCDYSQSEVKRIIPHRDPFLLIDAISHLLIEDTEQGILCERKINENDPVFQGHFPNYPVYPGALLIEMGGQAGLCLSYFLSQQTKNIQSDAKPAPIRATKVHGALFLSPVFPGDQLRIMAKPLEYDEYFGIVISQVLNGDKIACVSIAEVLFMDE